jgi:hypothetical protein
MSRRPEIVCVVRREDAGQLLVAVWSVVVVVMMLWWKVQSTTRSLPRAKAQAFSSIAINL